MIALSIQASVAGAGRNDYEDGKRSQLQWIVDSDRDALPNVRVNFGEIDDTPVPADYDGDDKTDFAVVRLGSNGLSWIVDTDDSGFADIRIDFGQVDDKPLPGDFNADGIADFAVIRVVGGQLEWIIDTNRDGAADKRQAFGKASDTASPADYDGDGRIDFAVLRDSSGQIEWIVDTQGNGIASLRQTFGKSTDAVHPADYDGDGKADFAVTRIVDGQLEWIIDTDRDGTADFRRAFGNASDTARPADFNGDGQSDLAVVRAADGQLNWIIDDDHDGLADKRLSYGRSSDLPVPSDYDGDGATDLIVVREVSYVNGAGQSPTLTEDTPCQWGAADCNRCVENVESELDRIENRYEDAGRIRFDGYAYPTPDDYLLHRISKAYEHVQSIGRIAGVSKNNLMVITHSTKSDQSGKPGALAVVHMGASPVVNGGPFEGMPSGDGSRQKNNRTIARTYTGNNHPGGSFVLGHHVYVAQWCQPHGNDNWCKRVSGSTYPNGFSVYNVSKAHANITSINSRPPVHEMYEHTGDDAWIDGRSTSSIAAVKLSKDSFLVALGRSGGREYGFYRASTPTGPFRYITSSSIDKHGENAAIVSECKTGRLYFMQMEGYGSGNDVDKVHLYRLSIKGDRVSFNFVKSRTFHCRGQRVDGAGDWCHFDAGAGVYVTPGGRLILYATDWHQSSSGNIRLVEFR